MTLTFFNFVSSFGKFFTMDQLNAEIGPLMEKVTRIMAYFWQLGLTRKELLCLMVILLLSHGKSVS